MKYFTYDLISTANDWIEQSEEAQLAGLAQFNQAAARYEEDLKSVRQRISKSAWEFFANGWGPTGLHDGRLLSLCVGDGLDYKADGQSPFLLNRQKLSARISFLNDEQNLVYIFEMKGLERMSGLIKPSGDSSVASLGDLYTYEITVVSDKLLQLAFLFASGATVDFDFRRLVFRKQRLKRQYAPGEKYRL